MAEIIEWYVAIEKNGSLCDVYLFGRGNPVTVQNLPHNNESNFEIAKRAKKLCLQYGGSPYNMITIKIEG